MSLILFIADEVREQMKVLQYCYELMTQEEKVMSSIRWHEVKGYS